MPIAKSREQQKGMALMPLKYYCPKCSKRYVDWGAEKINFKCPDCEGANLYRVGTLPEGDDKAPSLSKRPAKKKAKAKTKAKAKAKAVVPVDVDVADDVDVDIDLDVDVDVDDDTDTDDIIDDGLVIDDVD